MTDSDIGPYYRWLGLGLLVMFALTVGTFLAAIILQVPLTDVAIKALGGIAGIEMLSALILIIRPKRFDDLFKTVVSALPFTRYQKPEGA